jgi:hypothetical protein
VGSRTLAAGTTLALITGMRPLLASALLLSIAACSADYTEPRQLLPAPTRSNLVVYVSNQSFDIDPVDIDITLDRKPLIEGDFLVEGQHTWLRFEFDVGSGTHELVAETSAGPASSHRLTTGGATRFVVINFWYYPPGSGDPTGPLFTIDEYDEQPYFE